MTYQVLARKWRPQDFDGLVGQEAIVTALRNAVRDQRIAQAYLFSGIRGVGKTTAARLLAKALNCENGPAENPCNDCTACREITAGSDIDVLEIDAATYSKVEQVRELTESLRYGPARDRRKVVVLDEVHRLSRQAFDALLKIVEEPPEHLTFIFATTEIEAVPATILSRCQEFHFRRVPANELVAHLRKICEAEPIEASDTALRLIARAGEGSVRDSVALLDQLATFGGGAVAEEDASRLLGGLDTATFETVLRAMLAGDGAVLTRQVESIEDRGYDPRSAFAQTLDYIRDALHLALDADSARIDLPEDERERMVGLAKQAGSENLLRILHLLVRSEPLVRRVEDPALALEIAWLRAAELPKLVALERAIAGDPGSSRVEVGALGDADAPTAESSDGGAAAPRADQKAAPQARSAKSSDDSARGEDQGNPTTSQPPRRESSPAERELEQAGATSAGAAAAPSPEAPASPSADPADLEKAAEHPGVQAVLTVFGGRVESIESTSGGTAVEEAR